MISVYTTKEEKEIINNHLDSLIKINSINNDTILD